MRWLETGKQDLPRDGAAERRDTSNEQVRAQWREAVTRTAALDKEVAHSDESSAPAFAYCGDLDRGDYCQLDSGLAAIPGPSLAVTADLRDILFPEEQYLITETILIKPKSEWPALPVGRGRVHVGVKQGHYPALLTKMAESNMVTFLAPGPDVIENSLFGVWKEVGKSQRLIWGGNNSNALFRSEASHVKLPTPALLSTLLLPPGHQLHLASCDIAQFYNRLRAPAFLTPFLGLPRVRASLVGVDLRVEFFVPCLQCIPMGATFAVRLAQAASLAIARRAGVSRSILSSKSHPRVVRHAMGTLVVYIDDRTVVSTSSVEANRAIHKLIATLAAFHLPDAPHKRQMEPSIRPGEALGLWWWPAGVLTIKPLTAKKLKTRTERLLSSGLASPKALGSLLGIWIWAFLLRRGLLSVLEASFAFVALPKSDKPRRLPRNVRVELSMLLDLFPLMYADLRMPSTTRVCASDASTTGGGVVYCDLASSSELDTFTGAIAETRIQKGWYSTLMGRVEFSSPDAQGLAGPTRISRGFEAAVRARDFKTAVSTEWRFKQHINMLEIEAAILAVRHMRRSPATLGQKVVLLVDNTSALGALGKGCSSSSALNNHCRRFFAAQLRADVQILLYWVPSELNPADGPSRATAGRHKPRMSGTRPPSGGPG